MFWIFFITNVLLFISIDIGYYMLTRSKKIYGYIDVDPVTNQCRFRLSNDELTNRKIKQVVFIVNHDVSLPVNNTDDSRDELVL